MARYWFNNSNHSVNLLFTFGPRVDKKSIPIGIGAAFAGIISTVSALHCNIGTVNVWNVFLILNKK